MKKDLFIVTISLLTLTQALAQTNVSGGIYSNTTWTLANSPYILTDTVVVFPGVTLTIQPGVTVKFNSGVQLEIRQGRIFATGTNADSITFTSNTSLSPGSWNEIILNGGTMTSKFSYCNFRYASTAINDERANVEDTLIIQNSNFSFNDIGINGQGTGYGIIDSCNFKHNTSTGAVNIFYSVFNYCTFLYNSTGIVSQFCIINNCILNYNGYGFGGYKANQLNSCTINYNQTGISCQRGCSVNNCNVSHNQYGIVTGNSIHDDGAKVKNTIIDSNAVEGISINNSGDSIFNNQIKYNGIGMIYNMGGHGWPNIITKNNIENNSTGLQFSISENFYCNKICNNASYDLEYTGSNNLDISNNYWCTTDSTSMEAKIFDGYDNINLGLVKFMPMDVSQCYLATGIQIYEVPIFSFTISPNPATDNLTIKLPANISKSEIKIYNMLGELEYTSTETKQKTDIDVSGLTTGLHIIQIATGDKICRQKFIKK